MKKFLVLIIPLFIFSSCTTWYYGTRPKHDITQIERTTFDDLIIEPAHDLFDYRYDVVRQINGFPQPLSGWTAGCEGDPLPHYPLGVRLGNGLFFDLNRNLTLDLFSVLSLPKAEQLSIKKTAARLPNRPYRIRIDSTEYCEKTPNGRRWICKEFAHSGDLIQVKERNRPTYNVVEEESSIKLINRRGRVLNEINKVKDGVYTHQLRRIINSFIQLENGVQIKSNQISYRIVLTPEKDEIQIYRSNGLGERLVRRMIKSKDKLYILNHKNRGSEIEIMNDKLVTRGVPFDDVELEVTFPTRD
ncbi:MAG: hypothetical protein AB8G22_21455 [Saprospiraceae bacterium]